MDDYANDDANRNADDYADDYADAAPAGPPPRPAFLKRFWMVFLQPGALFESLAQNPAWFPVAMFVGLGTGVVMAFVPTDVFVDQLVASGVGTADDMAAGAVIVKALAVGSPIVVSPLMVVITSAVTYAIFVFMRGDEATYRQHLCVIAHTGIISLVGAVIMVPLLVATGSGTFGAGLTVGTLAPFLSEGLLLNFLNSLPLFQLWQIAVAGIGLAAIDPRRRAGPTIAVLMLVQVVVALACSVLATAFSPTF